VRPIEVLFVDKGGVLIDNSHLSPQWRRLIGEFLSLRLGGSAEAWGVANIPAFEAQVERWRVAMAGGGPADDPRLAAVVDDSPAALSWARECGMRGFLVDRQQAEDFDDAVTRTFAEVAAQAITSGSGPAS
jgi:hypothetical protein